MKDNVYTDPALAKRIVQHFQPSGLCLDPCRGTGAFYNAMPINSEWCEIDDGVDFLTYEKQVDWIITNPPFSGKLYRAISQRAFRLSNNVVFLCRFDLALGISLARHQDFLQAGHSIKEIIMLPFNDAKFIDQNNETVKSGFPLSAIHWQKNYDGETKWRYWI